MGWRGGTAGTHGGGGRRQRCCLLWRTDCIQYRHVSTDASSPMASLQSPSNYGRGGVGQLLGASSQASIPVSTDSAAALDGSRRIWLSFVNRAPARAAGSRRSDSPMPHDPSTVSTVNTLLRGAHCSGASPPSPPLYARLLQPLIVCVQRWLQI